jgi:hypothetical protein
MLGESSDNITRYHRSDGGERLIKSGYMMTYGRKASTSRDYLAGALAAQEAGVPSCSAKMRLYSSGSAACVLMPR